MIRRSLASGRPSRLALGELILALALAVIACGAPVPSGMRPATSDGAAHTEQLRGEASRLADLYAAARQEGEVTFDSAQSAEQIQPLIDRFGQKYPGIHVTYTNRTAVQTVERVLAESATGHASVDTASSSIRTILPLYDRSLMMSVDWPALEPSLPPEALTLGGVLPVWHHLPYVMVYNTTRVNSGDAPKDWEDLLGPQWQGRKIVLDSRGIPVEHLPFVWGESRAYAYLAKLRGQNLLLVPRGSMSIERVAAGEAPVGGADLPNVFEYQDRGAPLALAHFSVYGVGAMGLFALKDAPHPNASQLWIAFLLSPEARQLFEERTYYAWLFPGATGRMATELQGAGSQLFYLDDTIEKARERGDRWNTVQQLLGGLPQ